MSKKMIKASVAYEMMEKALHLIPSHESNSTYLSAYGVFNLESGDCVAVRAANHGTFLYNWLKMQDKPFNVDLLTSANIAITLLDGSIPFSQNNNIEMDNGAEPPVFVVRQYVYNCAVLDTNDINVIISASKKLIVDGVYTDPFEEDGTKHAIIYREKTNEPPKDVTAKTLKKHRAAKKKREQHTDNNQELNTEQYMNKKLIRLTEQDLHKIVKESVGKIINEIGDTPKGQRGLGALHARKVLRNNDLSDDIYNYAQNARGGDKYDNRGNNENPLYHDYANGYIDYLNSHPDEYIANKRKRMSESYLHRIVKESVNRILSEDQEGYNQVMSTLNNPTAQKGLKKAWNKERKKNPNADYDTFEYNHALNLQNKKRKEDERYATVKESVNRIINEIGDTQRGQWMLGRLAKRQSDGGGKFNRGLSGINYASDRAYDANGGMYSKDYLEGYEDEGNNGRNADSTWDGNKYRRMQFNYDAKKMSDMDKLGRKFIDFIEHYKGGVLLQTIVDYESGNQTGKPESPLKELIPIFEEEVLGYDWGTKCTPEMRQAIKDAYNQWWAYAQDQLMPNEEY